MAETIQRLDMSLDDIIKKNKRFKGQNSNITTTSPSDRHTIRTRRGSGYGGPTHRRGPTRSRPYPFPQVMFEEGWRRINAEMQVVGGYGTRKEEQGTKLYVSNLHYQVSDDDIKVLFSEVGELKTYGIHYDECGRSKGSAEVVYREESDGLAAMKRYNHLRLDGRPLHIDGAQMEQRRRGTSSRDLDHARVSAQQLDAELETYHRHH